MKPVRRTPLFATLATLGLAACAHAPARSAAPVDAAAPAEAAAVAPAPAATGSPPPVVVTGSRLPQQVDLSSGLPRTTSSVTVWTPEQLQSTGAPRTGEQLKKLTP